MSAVHGRGNGHVPDNPGLMNSSESFTASLNAIVQSAGDGLIATGMDGRIDFLNAAAQRLVGLDSATAEGRLLYDVLRMEESDGRPVRNDLVELAMLSEVPVGLGTGLTLRLNGGAARQIEGEISVRCGNKGSPNGTVITIRDVTARTREDLQRREDEKMRAVAQLAGTVAHEVNNLLTVIVGHRESIDDRFPRLAHLLTSTAEIQRAATEIAGVTRHLLSLSQRHILLPQPTDLNTMLTAAGPDLELALPRNIALTLTLEAKPGMVFVDVKSITQAIADLLGYCCKRMPGGGRIDIRTSSMTIDRHSRGRHLRRYIQLTIADTGPTLDGISAETVFEPAWGSNLGRPSGLGLFAVRSVVNGAEGHLSIDNECETGMRFILSLPQMEEDLEMPEMAPGSEGTTAPQTILLVEDDDAIRILLRNSLEMSDYRVLEARDASEALFQAEIHDGAIHLVVTDVVMPTMNGPAMVRELQKSRQDVKVILISGGPDETAAVQALVMEGASFFQKPFSQRQLMTAIKELLTDG